MLRHPELPQSKRLAAASLAGRISRLTHGSLSHLDRAEKLASIREVSADPAVLGHTLGPLFAPEHHAPNHEAIGLLRELGANEDVAAAVAAWQLQEQELRRTQRYR